MYRIDASIRGVAPILFNRFADPDAIRRPSAGGSFTDEQRLEEALLKVHRNGHGVYLPAWNLKCCIVDGARRGNLKEGKKSVAPFIQATVFPEDAPFGKAEPDEIHETWGRKPPRTGGACLIKRPMFRAGWELPLVINVVDDRRDPETLRRALEEAGMLVGVGSWRPEYGRFIVTEWGIAN